MKIVRFKKENKKAFGVTDNNAVYELKGDPLEKCDKGKKIGNLNEIVLLTPCEPRKIIAVAINFKGIEGFSEAMSEPMVFIKPGTCVCAPNTKVENPFPSLPWWGEAELGVVIKNVPKYATDEQVRKGILGFTIGNDVTVENVEGRDHHLARSKCPDNFCPLGPWIDTEFDASDCLIEAVQNGEVIRKGRSSQQFWQWPKIIKWLSTWITLEPWDVVLTGNPPDTVGMRFLNNGDTYTARIQGLGELTNKFVLKKGA